MRSCADLTGLLTGLVDLLILPACFALLVKLAGLHELEHENRVGMF